MQTFVTRNEMNNWSRQQQAEGRSIGFVPTMGALHYGHLTLVQQACAENDVVVVSIFVNPKQFNNPSDLAAYPRTLEQDLEKLHAFKNVHVFAPSVDEMYPENFILEPMPLGTLGEVMEAKFRPGHFEGVVQVVHQLFKIVLPQRAYFGKKDFQQLAVIQKLTRFYQFPIQIIPCETCRENDGLAMSSRNLRLTEAQKKASLILIAVLNELKNAAHKRPLNDVLHEAKQKVASSELRLEYLEIADPETLISLNEWQAEQVCCIAAYCGEVRLIDNMLC
ncbi:MAG: hypothetical protein RLZZ301_473 [Bacteroidota bacterium]